ncbi:MAG: hypothetical protein H8D26_06520, partial [Methanomicrobia archaeon]|nr:hypothetical protein [Methanomicrobia archaeon]
MNELHFHLDEGKRFFDLACGKTNWKCGAPPHDPASPVRAYWSDKDKRALVRKPDIIRAIDLGNEDVARIIAIDRVIEYIKQGKITITGSYNFQDLGKRIKEVQLCENEGFLTDKIVEQLIHGEFSVNFWPLLDFRYRDSERFWNIRYFIQRYLTEPCLRLELKFIYRCMEKLTGNTVEGVVVDTMGIDGRK